MVSPMPYILLQKRSFYSLRSTVENYTVTQIISFYGWRLNVKIVVQFKLKILNQFNLVDTLDMPTAIKICV